MYVLNFFKGSTNLHEEHVSCVVSSPVYSERLLLHHATPHRLQIYVIAMLKYTEISQQC